MEYYLEVVEVVTVAAIVVVDCLSRRLLPSRLVLLEVSSGWPEPFDDPGCSGHFLLVVYAFHRLFG